VSARVGAVGAPGERWSFLGVLLEECPTAPGTPVVGVITFPEGASPPLHVHSDLDDSFYVLDGTIVVRCGDDVGVAAPGSWVPFPSGVPHTFRVVDGPARVLSVHADDSFLAFVRDVGRPATDGDAPEAGVGPSMEELTRLSAVHGITNVGPGMSEEEARAALSQGVTRQA
jgi:mannose-6-phosphate isomerase-like protein (cupin superfamily)